ncbi:MAG: hypothetical protein KAQ71_11830 [Desulfobulbaceae bacterium]|jgi:hypothetical protein|nr:hypothetical protein [Desulfobulbaceae bacterium]
MGSENKIVIQEMKTRIDHIEKLALELKKLGREIPAVEKNSRNILSAVYNLKFGISDIAEIDAA